jgi:hypothetical protein
LKRFPIIFSEKTQGEQKLIEERVKSITFPFSSEKPPLDARSTVKKVIGANLIFKRLTRRHTQLEKYKTDPNTTSSTQILSPIHD